MPVIELSSISKHYQMGQQLIKAVDSLDLTIDYNEYIVFIGSSGSGKSTLMNILGFLDRPDGGVYRFDGADLAAADDDTLSALRNRKIGFVFQRFHLLERASALENVLLPVLYADDDVQGGADRARRVLEEVGLGHRAHHGPGELSGGEQQRVAIARALIMDPALLLADEPTGNLDPKTSEVVYDLFMQLQAARGIAFLIATHNPELARRADRIYRLVEGRARQVSGTAEGASGLPV